MTVKLSGEQMTWHKTTLDFDTKTMFSEEPSTFRDYRLDVTFTNETTRTVIEVPGFFAADGDAANSGATSGSIWRVNFNPPETGNWTYEVSFRTGNDIAAKTNPTAGSAVSSIDGLSGTFEVMPTDKTGEDFRAKGMIVQDEGTHYLQHQGDGDYFIRGGPGVPENFLASSDIDNTPGTHAFLNHVEDLNAGDPAWNGDSGAGIIGAINYLAEQGQNSIYVMLLTAAGDGKDVWPWAADDLQNLSKNTKNLDPDITSVYDVSKLSQWEMIFDHMDEEGIYKNVLLQEQENDQLLNGGTDASGTSLSVERMIYMREMVARFGHNNGIQWNLGEENTNTDQEREDMSSWLETVDPYDHLVVAHSFPDELQKVYNPLLGHEPFDGTSFQATAETIRQKTEDYRDRSANNNDPWVISWDEDSSRNSVIDPYTNDPNSTNEAKLRDAFWGMLTAGGSGGNWYIRTATGQSLDQNMDDFKGYESLWTWTAAATEFFNTYIPFWDMAQADGLTPDGDDYVMADPGNYYVVYLPGGEAKGVRLDLSDQAGETFNVYWYNPRTGGDLIADGSIDGGSMVQLGDAPSGTSKDWVLFVRNSSLPELPVAANNPPPSDDNVFVDPDPVPPSETSGVIARDDSASTAEGDDVRIFVLENDED
ncbi:MAG: DUF5060 domain-containing protein, partial [Pseudomonadota bacterium]